MSNEITVACSLGVRKGNLQYVSGPSTFRATLTATDPKGPTPGSLTIPTTGEDVAFAELAAGGGMCRIINLDDTNYVRLGVKSGATILYWGKLLPGEQTVFRLDDLIQAGPGTGGAATLHLRSNTASCIVNVDAFDA